MKSKRHSATIILCGLLTLSSMARVFADSTDSFIAIQSVASATSSFVDEVNVSASERKELQAIQSGVSFLMSRWDANTNVSAEYLESLRYDEDVLTREAHGTPTVRQAAIEFVARDIHAKQLNCAASSSGLGESVSVNVRTILGTRIVSGYQVFYNHSFDDGYIQPKQFGPLTSPANQQVSAGSYVFWVTYRGKIASEKKPQDIGVGPVNIDLSVQ